MSKVPVMSISQNDLDKIIQERDQLRSDLEQSFGVIVGLLDVFGIEVANIDKVQITTVAKAMKNLAFDAMLPGSASKLERKFSFLLEAKGLADRYQGDLIRIQNEIKAQKTK